MTQKIDLKIDITDAVTWPAEITETMEMAVSVYLPDPRRMPNTPIVIFAFPGGGYSRGYYDMDLSRVVDCDADSFSQAAYHVAQGFIVVTCDHICVGESTFPARADLIQMEHLAASGAAMVEVITSRLESGELDADFPNLDTFKTIGMGQSMGAGIVVGTQSQCAPFDAICVLAQSMIATVNVLAPPDEMSGEESAMEEIANLEQLTGLQRLLDYWYSADVPQAIVEHDTSGGYPLRQTAPPYGSLTVPPCALEFIQPGYGRDMASKITVPVLIGVGDMDVILNPEDEPSAYSSSSQVDLVIIPEMRHMHNFSATRTQLWDAIEAWAKRA